MEKNKIVLKCFLGQFECFKQLFFLVENSTIFFSKPSLICHPVHKKFYRSNKDLGSSQILLPIEAVICFLQELRKDIDIYSLYPTDLNPPIAEAL